MRRSETFYFIFSHPDLVVILHTGNKPLPRTGIYCPFAAKDREHWARMPVVILAVVGSAIVVACLIKLVDYIRETDDRYEL